MNTVSAKDARAHFSELLDDARLAPVKIQKNGRDVAVIMSAEEYAHFEALEDLMWLERAKKAEKSGFTGTKAGEKWLKGLLNAQDKPE